MRSPSERGSREAKFQNIFDYGYEIGLVRAPPGISRSYTDRPRRRPGPFRPGAPGEARQDFERERAAIAEEKKEEYLTPEMVKTLLRISESTLYRMAKAKILIPVFVGGQKRYRQDP